MVVLIFIFVFAGQGIFDSFLPLMDAKAVITTAFKGGVFDFGDGERYLVKKSENDQYERYMLDQGYMLSGMGDDYYIFVKDGKEYKFEREEVLKFFYKFKVD
jgi:hypothetical protein